MRIIFVLVQISTVLGECDKWMTINIGGAMRQVEGDGARINCENHCNSIFSFFGVNWRKAHPECSCITEGAAYGAELFREYFLNCGFFLQRTKVSIGEISKVRNAYDFKVEPDESVMEIFATDGLVNITYSDRLIITNPDKLLNALVTRTLYRSNLTKHYNRIHDAKDLSSERTAETFILEYKMGDVGLENETLWITKIKSNNHHAMINIYPVHTNTTVKENDLVLDIAQERLGNEVIFAIELRTTGNPTADLLDVAIILQPESGLTFLNMTFTDELSMDFTAELITEKYQSLTLSRLTIDSFVAFNITYSLDAGVVHVGERLFGVLNEFEYTNYTANVPSVQLRSEPLLESFIVVGTTATIVRPEKTSHVYHHTIIENEKEIIMCLATFQKTLNHGCFMYSANFGVVKKLPSIMSHLTGYNNETSVFYAKTTKGNVLSFSGEERKIYISPVPNDYDSSPKFIAASRISIDGPVYTGRDSLFEVRYEGVFDLVQSTYLIKF